MKNYIFKVLFLTLLVSIVTTGFLFYSDFFAEEYELKLDIEGKGNIDPGADTYKFDEGETIEVSASEVEGWQFYGWHGWEADITNTKTTLELEMDRDKELTAKFIPEEYRVNINYNPDKGSLDIKPIEETYYYKDTVTIEITPKSGYEFSHWSGDIDSTEQKIELTVKDDMELDAKFVEKEVSSDEKDYYVEPDPPDWETEGDLYRTDISTDYGEIKARHINKDFFYEEVEDFYNEPLPYEWPTSTDSDGYHYLDNLNLTIGHYQSYGKGVNNYFRSGSMFEIPAGYSATMPEANHGVYYAYVLTGPQLVLRPNISAFNVGVDTYSWDNFLSGQHEYIRDVIGTRGDIWLAYIEERYAPYNVVVPYAVSPVLGEHDRWVYYSKIDSEHADSYDLWQKGEVTDLNKSYHDYSKGIHAVAVRGNEPNAIGREDMKGYNLSQEQFEDIESYRNYDKHFKILTDGVDVPSDVGWPEYLPQVQEEGHDYYDFETMYVTREHQEIRDDFSHLLYFTRWEKEDGARVPYIHIYNLETDTVFDTGFVGMDPKVSPRGNIYFTTYPDRTFGVARLPEEADIKDFDAYEISTAELFDAPHRVTDVKPSSYTSYSDMIAVDFLKDLDDGRNRVIWQSALFEYNNTRNELIDMTEDVIDMDNFAFHHRGGLIYNTHDLTFSRRIPFDMGRHRAAREYGFTLFSVSQEPL